MDATFPTGQNRIVRSPSVSPSRPLSIRHLSGDIDTYIGMYGLTQGSDHGNENAGVDRESQIDDSDHDFLFSSDVAQELKNLRTLRRLSLDGAKLDPDVPSQNYEVAPAMKKPDETEDDMGNSLYWVPARIHPELAPQEWQTFVQKTGGKLDDAFAGPLRGPAVTRGLTRAKSLLSREVNQGTAERYTDAGPALERRRSRLQPSIKVADLENLAGESTDRVEPMNRSLSQSSVSEETSDPSGYDEPILKPPPGQILRRAARTGKAKGSYRKLVRTKTPPNSSTDLNVHETSTSVEGVSQQFESETIQLRDDAPRDKLVSTTEDGEVSDSSQVGRKKSKNRTIQIVGPKSPTNVESQEAGEDPFASEWPIRPVVIAAPGEPSLGRNDVIIPAEVLTENQHKFQPLPAAGENSEKSPIQHSANSLESNNSTSIEQIANGSVPDEGAPASSVLAGLPVASGAREASNRPGLKRELSAASLTRAVMNGTAPVASVTKSPPRRTIEDHADQSAAPTTSHTSGKKSAWGKLFSSEDKDKSKLKKDPRSGMKIKKSPSQDERPSAEKETATTNLFSSIFGNKKRDKDTAIDPPKREVMPTPTVLVKEPQFYSRYPIQLERAIYRMAHLKLGNSRRPLAHQVLLSNFMYGYLRKVGISTTGSAQGPSASQRVKSQSSQRTADSTEECPRRVSTQRHSQPIQEQNDSQQGNLDSGTRTDNNTAHTSSSNSPTSTVEEGAHSRRPQRPGQARRSSSMEVGKYQQ